MMFLVVADAAGDYAADDDDIVWFCGHFCEQLPAVHVPGI